MRRGLRTVVYDDTLPDARSEQLGTIDEVMPTPTPPMDNVMPSEPGMEDPRLRQIALADGGIVEREGFAEGTNIQKEFLFNFIKENQGISNKAKAEKLNKLGYINSRGGPITKTLLEAFITRNPELKGKGKNVVSSLEDLKKEASPKQLSDFESGLIDEKTFRNRVVVGRGDKKRTPEYTQAASKRKYERVMADPERKAKLKETQARFMEKKYLEKGMFPPAKTPKDAFWRDLLRAADKNDRVSWVSERPNKFPRNVFEELELMDNKTGKKITYNNLSNHPQYPKAIKAYEKKFLINQLDIPYDIKEKITYQRKSGGMTNNIVIQHSEGIGKNPFNTSIATQFENLHEDKIKNKFNKNFNKAKTLTEKKQIVKNFITELSEKTPNIISQPGKKPYGSEKTLSELVSKGLDKNELKIFNTALEKLKPIEKQVFNKFGKLAMGFDPTDVLKTLPEKEVEIMKKAMGKLGNVAKLGARGLQELAVGTGPVGIGITAALTVPFMIADMQEGKRFSEALQNQASALTFGAIPEADKRIIEEIGGPEAGVGFEIQQNIDNLKSLQNDLRETEKRTSEDIMDPESELVQSNRVENIRRSIDKTFQDLLPYLDEQGKLIAPEYQSYLQAKNKLEQERTLRKGISDMKAYDSGFDDITGFLEKGPLSKDISKAEQYKKKLEEGYSANKNKPSINFIGMPLDNIINRNLEFAYGGRVNFETGGDPKDKPILPINPMMDEGPQDPSKREFLKGAGGIGLAGLLVGTGLLKLGKSAAVSSKISSMIKNTTAPSWMEALITKVMKEGTDSPVNYIGRNKFSSVPDDTIITKELKFKNPETGQMEEVRLRINQDKDTIHVDYLSGSGNTVADQGVTFEISPQKEIILSKDGKYLIDNPVKGQYEFHAIEAEPRVVNWDGDIEWDGEAARKKIIYLNSDISGLKSFVTGGKGIDKKVAKAKREAADYVEKNPNEYLENAYDPMSIDTSYYND